MTSCVYLCLPLQSIDAETKAGQAVDNTASFDYSIAGVAATGRSNQDAITVAERLDVALARIDAAAIAAGADSMIPLLLTNRGNGSEGFVLAAAGTGATPRTIAIDADGDGRYDPARDQALADGRTAPLAPGEQLRLVIVVDASPPEPAPGVTITARAVTGSGTPGTIFARQGDGGGDAVVGPTGAMAELVVPLGRGDPAPSLLKAQSVLAPDGSARPVRGAIVTYTLTASFAAAAGAARIDDPLPAGTRYVAGSLSLDSLPLTDADDGDAGRVDATIASVSLGDIAAPATRTIRFKVQIQ